MGWNGVSARDVRHHIGHAFRVKLHLAHRQRFAQFDEFAHADDVFVRSGFAQKVDVETGRHCQRHDTDLRKNRHIKRHISRCHQYRARNRAMAPVDSMVHLLCGKAAFKNSAISVCVAMMWVGLRGLILRGGVGARSYSRACDGRMRHGFMVRARS
jgi:hypothetical protein